MITSAQNPKIKRVRSLISSSRSRRKENAFVIEGVRLAEEALQAKWSAQAVFHSQDLSQRAQELLENYAAQGAPLEMVSPGVMRLISDTETPQGILVVLDREALPLPEALSFVLVPDGVRDPGNLGTMLRTAAAAGVDAVLLPPGNVDPFAPKVLRAGMGAHFRLPVYSMDWSQIRRCLAPLAVYLADAAAGMPYTQADFQGPIALVIGGEAEGAGPQAQALAAGSLHIPMPGGGESLNAAIAAAVLLFEVARQRA